MVAWLRCCVAAADPTLRGIRGCGSVSGPPGPTGLRIRVNLQKRACEKGNDEYQPQVSLHLPAKCVSIAVGSESEQSRYLNAVQCFLKKPAIPPKSVAPGVVPL